MIKSCFAIRTLAPALVRAAALMLFHLAGGAEDSSAQELNAEQREFLTRFKAFWEIGDQNGAKTHASRGVQHAEAVLDAYTLSYGATKDEKYLTEIEPLARLLDEFQHARRFQHRIEYLKTLSLEQHQKRLQALIHLRDAIVAFVEANNAKEQSQWRSVQNLLNECLRDLLDLKDFEWSSFTRFHLGIAYDSVGDYMECVLEYDKGIDEWTKGAERPKETNYSYMVDRRRELIGKGYDPFAKSDTGASAAGTPRNSGTSYKEGSDWVTWVTSYKPLKSPDAVTSPSVYWSTNLMLWRWCTYMAGVNELPFKLHPFQADLRVIKEGSKGYLDLTGDDKGDLEVKIIDGKPSVAEFAAGPEKDADRYALFLMTIGQSQQYLGQSVNFNNRCVYRPAFYRQGKILDQPLLVFDDNCSGTIGDALERRDAILHGNPSFIDTDAMIIGKGTDAIPFSDFVKVGESWHRLKVTHPQATEIQSRELSIQSGFIQVKWNGPVAPASLVVAEVRDFQGAYFNVAGKTPVEVPAGRYEIAYGKLEVGKGMNADQAWILKGKSQPFEVKAGEIFTLSMGAPYTFDFAVENPAKKFVVKGRTLVVYDVLGAMVGRIYDEIPVPEVSVRTESGSSVGPPKDMKRIDSETFNKDNSLAWFPADFEVEKGGTAKYQARLSLKKHKLLGGPFDSEWK